jgi:tetratricopeptide (TPR) repeat protein
MLLIVIACGIASAQRLTNYRDEIDLWRQVSTLEPQDYIARDTLGHLLVSSGRVPEAIEEFQAALALNPDYPDALNNLGHAFLVSERESQKRSTSFKLLSHSSQSLVLLTTIWALPSDYWAACRNPSSSSSRPENFSPISIPPESTWAVRY